MKVNAEIKKGIGKKSGKEYVCIEITFPNGYKKVVFPDSASEKFMFESFLNR